METEKKRISLSYVRTPETRKKVSDSLKGRKHTEERKQHISEGMKKWWAERKARQEENNER